jgi:hypothetical protein
MFVILRVSITSLAFDFTAKMAYLNEPFIRFGLQRNKRAQKERQPG